jgi:uncharacterized membrane protein required for colicin V production
VNRADLIVLVWIALAALSGWRRGLVAQLVSLSGLALGGFLGSRAAPLFLEDHQESPWLPLASLAGALVGALVLQIAAGTLGSVVRAVILRGPLRLLDSAGGILLGAAFGAAIAWLVAVVALHQPAIGLRRHVQDSAILTGLVERFPPGEVLSALGTFDPLPLLSGFPDARLPEPDARLAATPEARASALGVVRVLGTACGLGVQGSGWIARRGLVVTNAHVVAGQRETTVFAPNGQGLPGAVVFADARTDVAIVRVRGLTAPALELATRNPDGDQVFLLGYPHNGPLTPEPATAGRPTGVIAPDGLGRRFRFRTVVPLRGSVEPGDSGGPVVGLDGKVVAMMFGATRQGDGGVGVPLAAISEALSSELGPVDPGPCAS